MADILSAKIQVTAPNAEKTFSAVANAAVKTNDALKKLPSTAQQATGSLVNLGRVVQDAPFGFIGIANNLNPLIEGFGRLRTASGSTGAALKALGGSLLGAGGIGLGVSLVSSALVLFGDRLFGAGKAAKAADESLTNLAKKFSDQAGTLTVLVGIVQNVNAAYDEKQKALKAINQEYGPYLRDLGIEEVTANNVADAYDRIVQAMLRQAVVKGVQDQITESVRETAKELIRLQVGHEKARIAAQERQKAENQTDSVKTRQNLDFLSSSLEQYQRGAQDGAIASQTFNREQVKAGDNAKFYNDRVTTLTESLKRQLAPLLNLTTNFEDLDIKLDKLKAKKVKIETEVRLAIPDRLDTPLADLFKNITLDIKGIKFREIPLTDLQKAQEKMVKGLKPAEVTFKVKQDQAALESYRNAVLDFNKQIQDSLTDTAVGFAEAFGGLVAAPEEAGKVLIRLIATLIERIGKALVAFGIAKTGIDKILKNPLIPGGFAIGLGLTAIATAALLKGIAGRALGGPVQKGQPYIVGETGRELFIPDTGGKIVSHSELASMSGGRNTTGGAAFQIYGEFVQRGNDMVATINRVLRSQGRLT